MPETVRLRNTNPLGRVDLPLLRREGDVDGEGVGCLEPGEQFDCPAEYAKGLLAQVGNYERVDVKPRKAAAKKATPKSAPASDEKGDA